jgi:hypothetical protein
VPGRSDLITASVQEHPTPKDDVAPKQFYEGKKISPGGLVKGYVDPRRLHKE